MKHILLSFLLFMNAITYGQTWQAVGGGTNNSSHGLLTWNGKLIDLGSFNNPCNRVAQWDGTSWSCLLGGVGIVARAGVVWDGKLVVVGDFWNVAQPCVGCNGVAVWDGVSWTPLGDGVNNDVLSVTVWNNQVVIAGDFTEADGVPIARIAKWNGTVWESVGPIGSFDNDIRAMVEFDGELWVGGDFNNVGGNTSYDGLVKYDPDSADWVGGNTGVDLIGGVDESVRVLYVNPNDGNLYMGGEFTELWDGDAAASDPNMRGIAMYDGSNWFPLGTGLNEYCRAIHEYNGDVVAGGYFTSAGGVPANKIARWNGTTWSAMGLGFDAVGIDEYVKSATVWNGIFFAGGAYTQAEGNPMDYISQWYEPPTEEPVAWMTASATSLCGSGCVYFLDNSTNAPTSWNWSFPGSDVPSSNLQDPGTVCYSSPGTYTATLQACNSFGCDTKSITIEVASGATVSVNNQSICDGGSATLVAVPSIPGGTYLWSTGATSPSITVNPTVTTNYSVVYSFAGCTTGPTVSTVTIGTTPTLGLNISTPTICEGDTAYLSATPSAPGGTYLWSPGGATTASIAPSPLTTTNYSVQYTLNGCTSLAQNGTVTVTPAPAVSAGNASICPGDSATLTAVPSSAGGTFAWIPGGATTASITVSPSATTNYAVIYTLGGCASEPDVAFVTVKPLPATSVSVSSNQITADQNSAIYQWLDCNNAFIGIPGANTQTYIPVTNGDYAVQIGLNGCVDTSACTTILSIGISELNDLNFIIYPNPTTGSINISGLPQADLEYEVIDLVGKVVSSGRLISGNSNINIQALSDGQYFLKIGKEEKQVFRITKSSQ
jgi:PKD repeat protein